MPTPPATRMTTPKLPPRTMSPQYRLLLWMLIVVAVLIAHRTFKPASHKRSVRSTTGSVADQQLTDDTTSAKRAGGSTIVTKKHSTPPAKNGSFENSRGRFAYAFLIGGCDKNDPSSRYFLYDVLVAAYVMQQDGSTADVMAMIQMGPNSEDDELQPEEEAWLKALGIKFYYIPRAGANSRYSIMMEKFRILSHTEYDRILFLDADVLPMGNMDYVFEMSMSGILKKNLVVPGLSTPSNGGFFMMSPYEGALEELNSMLQKKEVKQRSSEDVEEMFDPVYGWGHKIEPPDKWIKVNGSGTLWEFTAAYADQGLLYHFTKYHMKSLSIVLGPKVQNWGKSEINGTTILEEVLDEPFMKIPSAKYRGVVDNCWRWSTVGCYPPMADYQHFNGKHKPWTVGPPKDLSAETCRDSPQHLWFYLLSQLNDQLDMGLGKNLKDWPKEDKAWEPPVGFHLRPEAQQGVHTDLLG